MSSLVPGVVRAAKATELYVYDNFNRVPVDEVEAGDIAALCGVAVGAGGHVMDFATGGCFFG